MPIKIYIPKTELWDPLKEEFVTVNNQTILMEHSLLSIDKWESKWKKSYLSTDNKTPLEVMDYLRCMTITKDVSPYVYYAIPDAEMQKINAYIKDTMTATTFNENRRRPSNSREIITSEIIYWQMTQLNIPMEWERRHLNKLLTLIRVCAIKSQPPKKLSKQEIMRQNRALNAARRAKHHSAG